MPKKTPLEAVRAKISDYCNEFGRVEGDVKLIAVSKTRSAKAITNMVDAGQSAFGENYLQEALGKINHLKYPRLEWHFIGNIQSRKANLVAKNFDWVHTLDRLKVAQKLNDAVDQTKNLKVLVQLNIQNEESKSGVSTEVLFPLVEAVEAMPNLSLKGLMLIPESESEFDAQRRVFASARETLEQARTIAPHMTELSMGMSGDMRAAIAEGATMVRIGSALFGPREYNK